MNTTAKEKTATPPSTKSCTNRGHVFGDGAGPPTDEILNPKPTPTALFTRVIKGKIKIQNKD
jgi:hypothetical protein